LRADPPDLGALSPPPPPPQLAGLAQAVKQFNLKREDFIAVIDGMAMDVDADIRAPDQARLDLYCDRVACAVGRLSVRVFGMAPDAGLALAHHLGCALQLTNILRDLDEDAAMGRLYLPREALRDAGIISTDPATVLANPMLGVVCDTVVALAREHFRQARAIMAQAPRRVVRAPRIMGDAYRAILDKLVTRGFAPPRRPVRHSKLHLLLIVARNLV
jgi:presqualene diphosphate synthase